MQDQEGDEQHREQSRGEDRALVAPGRPQQRVHACCRRGSAGGHSNRQRRRDDVVLGDVLASQFPHHLAAIDDRDPVAHPDQLVIVGAIEQYRRAKIGKLADQHIQFLLGAHIDAARRVHQQQDAGVGRQPFAQHHLLLIAAGQRADSHSSARLP